MPRLNQETLAIIGDGIALAALILTSTAGIRGEIQSVRDELRGEIRDVRIEARTDRDMCPSHILRPTEQLGILGARLDGVADQPATEQ